MRNGITMGRVFLALVCGAGIAGGGYALVAGWSSRLFLQYQDVNARHFPSCCQQGSNASVDCVAAMNKLKLAARGLGAGAEHAKAELLVCEIFSQRPARGVAFPPQPAAPPPAAAALPPPPAKPAAEPRQEVASGGSAALDCQAFPPDCDGQKHCPPFSRAALVAALGLSPDRRAEQLRAWFCDQSPGGGAEQLTAALRSIGEALRPLPRLSAPAQARAPAAAEAERLLCELPWWRAFGEKGNSVDPVERHLGCPGCKLIDESGGDDFSGGSVYCPVDLEADETVCLLGYAAQELRFQDPPPRLESCRERAVEANDAWEAQTAARRLAQAKETVRRLTEKQPVADKDWAALVDAWALAHDRSEDPPPVAAPPDVRARLRPLLTGDLPEHPIATLQVTGLPGLVARVCDTLQTTDEQLKRRSGLFWVLPDRVVVIDPPRLVEPEIEEMSGAKRIPDCDALIEIADLDKDGAPELIIRRQESIYQGPKVLEVITLADPPLRRGKARLQSR